jgi:hypothetical protein
MKFALALLIAVHFWGDRNVPIPCHPVAVMNADAELPLDPVWGERFHLRVPMATYASDCRILISHNAETTDRIVAPERTAWTSSTRSGTSPGSSTRRWRDGRGVARRRPVLLPPRPRVPPHALGLAFEPGHAGFERGDPVVGARELRARGAEQPDCAKHREPERVVVDPLERLKLGFGVG